MKEENGSTKHSIQNWEDEKESQILFELGQRTENESNETEPESNDQWTLHVLGRHMLDLILIYNFEILFSWLWYLLTFFFQPKILFLLSFLYNRCRLAQRESVGFVNLRSNRVWFTPIPGFFFKRDKINSQFKLDKRSLRKMCLIVTKPTEAEIKDILLWAKGLLATTNNLNK